MVKWALGTYSTRFGYFVVGVEEKKDLGRVRAGSFEDPRGSTAEGQLGGARSMEGPRPSVRTTPDWAAVEQVCLLHLGRTLAGLESKSQDDKMAGLAALSFSVGDLLYNQLRVSEQRSYS